MTTVQTTATVAVTAGLALWAAWRMGTSALVAPWALAAGCMAFVAIMWWEAWRRRANREASTVLIAFAAGVAAMFVVLAEQLVHLAEHARLCD
ncbi:MAG TPA: hypothetical protein VK034_02890 [Enhygromyxa sp.]|nr:hypothetical protein [Enhygromyxa sp.]